MKNPENPNTIKFKKAIVAILNRRSEELNFRTSIEKEPEAEEWLWSGEFDDVANEIIELFSHCFSNSESEDLIEAEKLFEKKWGIKCHGRMI